MPVRLRRLRVPGSPLGLLLLAALVLAACGSGPIPGQLGGGGTTGTLPVSSGGTSGCTAASAKAAVTIDATASLKFVPAATCLKAGGTVTWKNVGNVYHTTTDEASFAATPADAALPAGATGWNHPLLPGSSWSLTLKTPGLYKYFCVPHESLGMLAQITVAG